MKISINQKLTIVGISEIMAHTTRRNAIVKSVLPEPLFVPDYVGATRGRWRIGTYSEPRKRKEYHLDLKESTLVFDGHDACKLDADIKHPTDTPGVLVSRFSGNACLNIAGSVTEVRALIEGKNLNDKFSAFDCVLAVTEQTASGDDGEPVFPEIQSGHAVIQRIRKARLAREAAGEPEDERAAHVAEVTQGRTIWNSDGTDGPCLICPPPALA